MLCIMDISGVTTTTMEEPVCLEVLKTRGRIPTYRLFPYPVGRITKQSFPLINYVTTASCSLRLDSVS